MDEHTLKRAVSVGAPKKRKPKEQKEVKDAAKRDWQSADFGRCTTSEACHYSDCYICICPDGLTEAMV